MKCVLWAWGQLKGVILVCTPGEMFFLGIRGFEKMASSVCTGLNVYRGHWGQLQKGFRVLAPGEICFFKYCVLIRVHAVQ